MSADDSKHVGADTINDYWVSTVWLGLDHNWHNTLEQTDKAHLFETMIHDEKSDEWLDYCERYSTWQEAEEGHKRACDWVKNGCKENQEKNEI